MLNESALLKEKGITVAEFRAVADVASARDAVAALGVPVWVRAESDSGNTFCMRVAYEADVPLAFARAQKYQVEGPVLVQKVIEGSAYRVAGFLFERELRAADVIQESFPPGPFRVAAAQWLPADLSGARYSEAVKLACQVVRALVLKSGPVEVEFVVTAGGPVITEVRMPLEFDAVIQELVDAALGVDLSAAAARVRRGEAPNLSPQRDMGAAACWIPSRSGIVTEIRGVDEASAVPGVQQVVIRVRPGEVLRHVVDAATRDRIGYVLAAGATGEYAIQAAQAARGGIEVITQSTLE